MYLKSVSGLCKEPDVHASTVARTFKGNGNNNYCLYHAIILSHDVKRCEGCMLSLRNTPSCEKKWVRTV